MPVASLEMLVVATVPEPGRLSVAPVGRVKRPVFNVNVRPVATFHLCPKLPRKVSPDWIVRFWVAALMSMPEEPSVSVLPALRVTNPPGPTMLRPAQVRSAPRATVFAPVTVLVQLAMSATPGKTPPVQLPVALSAVVLSALLTVAACAAGNENNTVMVPARTRTVLRAARLRGLGFVFMCLVECWVG